MKYHIAGEDEESKREINRRDRYTFQARSQRFLKEQVDMYRDDYIVSIGIYA